jgi:hypothetical protein
MMLHAAVHKVAKTTSPEDNIEATLSKRHAASGTPAYVLVKQPDQLAIGVLQEDGVVKTASSSTSTSSALPLHREQQRSTARPEFAARPPQCVPVPSCICKLEVRHG